MRQHVDYTEVLDGVIDITGAGTTTLVAAPGIGKAVRLLSYVFTCPASATVTWKSGTTAKSGAMTLANGVSAPTSGPTGRQFQCAANEALVLITGTSGVYGGHYTYQLVEVPH